MLTEEIGLYPFPTSDEFEIFLGKDRDISSTLGKSRLRLAVQPPNTVGDRFVLVCFRMHDLV